jgi:glycosyltransferase involved in cell wall biosynthesis
MAPTLVKYRVVRDTESSPAGEVEAHMSESHPKVTVGLPVYNGARKFLAAAIESVLNQTHRNLELLVSDNASTDETADVCLRYAERDPRVVYHRQERNVGAGPNHNWVARRASGKYFKWASDDDLMEPEYLEKCVAALEGRPDAVLCQSGTRIINERGESIANHLAHLDSPRASDRFAAIVLKPHWCVEVLGVIRTSALACTRL